MGLVGWDLREILMRVEEDVEEVIIRIIFSFLGVCGQNGVYFVDLVVRKQNEVETKKEAVYDNEKRDIIGPNYVNGGGLGLESKFFG